MKNALTGSTSQWLLREIKDKVGESAFDASRPWKNFETLLLFGPRGIQKLVHNLARVILDEHENGLRQLNNI